MTVQPVHISVVEELVTPNNYEVANSLDNSSDKSDENDQILDDSDSEASQDDKSDTSKIE